MKHREILVAPRDASVGLVGLGAREGEAISDDGVERRVDALDVSDVRLDDLASARSLLTDHRCELDG